MPMDVLPLTLFRIMDHDWYLLLAWKGGPSRRLVLIAEIAISTTCSIIAVQRLVADQRLARWADGPFIGWSRQGVLYQSGSM